MNFLGVSVNLLYAMLDVNFLGVLVNLFNAILDVNFLGASVNLFYRYPGYELSGCFREPVTLKFLYLNWHAGGFRGL